MGALQRCRRVNEYTAMLLQNGAVPTSKLLQSTNNECWSRQCGCWNIATDGSAARTLSCTRGQWSLSFAFFFDARPARRRYL